MRASDTLRIAEHTVVADECYRIATEEVRDMAGYRKMMGPVFAASIGMRIDEAGALVPGSAPKAEDEETRARQLMEALARRGGRN